MNGIFSVFKAVFEKNFPCFWLKETLDQKYFAKHSTDVDKTMWLPRGRDFKMSTKFCKQAEAISS